MARAQVGSQGRSASHYTHFMLGVLYTAFESGMHLPCALIAAKLARQQAIPAAYMLHRAVVVERAAMGTCRSLVCAASIRRGAGFLSHVAGEIQRNAARACV